LARGEAGLVGDRVGERVGSRVGDRVGERVGARVGDTVGERDGVFGTIVEFPECQSSSAFMPERSSSSGALDVP